MSVLEAHLNMYAAAAGGDEAVPMAQYPLHGTPSIQWEGLCSTVQGIWHCRQACEAVDR